MDKDKLQKMSLSELFMLIRNGSGATALSASEEIERRLSAQQSVQADVPYAPVKHPFACPECGRIGQVVCDNTARR